MWFKKKQKWFELQETLFEKRWAKSVIKVSPVSRIDDQVLSEGDSPWYFSVNTTEKGQDAFGFLTEQEATAAHESLVKWIKEVQ